MEEALPGPSRCWGYREAVGLRNVLVYRVSGLSFMDMHFLSFRHGTWESYGNGKSWDGFREQQLAGLA